MSQMHCTQPTMYKFFCLKFEIKTKADSYMPCEAMAHSTKSTLECNYNFINIIYALPLPRNAVWILCKFLTILGLILQGSLYAQIFTNWFHTFLRRVQSYTIEFNQICCSNILWPWVPENIKSHFLGPRVTNYITAYLLS